MEASTAESTDPYERVFTTLFRKTKQGQPLSFLLKGSTKDVQLPTYVSLATAQATCDAIEPEAWKEWNRARQDLARGKKGASEEIPDSYETYDGMQRNIDEAIAGSLLSQTERSEELNALYEKAMRRKERLEPTAEEEDGTRVPPSARKIAKFLHHIITRVLPIEESLIARRLYVLAGEQAPSASFMTLEPPVIGVKGKKVVVPPPEEKLLKKVLIATEKGADQPMAPKQRAIEAIAEEPAISASEDDEELTTGPRMKQPLVEPEIKAIEIVEKKKERKKAAKPLEEAKPDAKVKPTAKAKPDEAAVSSSDADEEGTTNQTKPVPPPAMKKKPEEKPAPLDDGEAGETRVIMIEDKKAKATKKKAKMPTTADDAETVPKKEKDMAPEKPLTKPERVKKMLLSSDFKFKSHEECLSKKRLAEHYMTKDDILEVIEKRPSLKESLPKGFKKLNKDDLCTLLFDKKSE